MLPGRKTWPHSPFRKHLVLLHTQLGGGGACRGEHTPWTGPRGLWAAGLLVLRRPWSESTPDSRLPGLRPGGSLAPLLYLYREHFACFVHFLKGCQGSRMHLCGELASSRHSSHEEGPYTWGRRGLRQWWQEVQSEQVFFRYISTLPGVLALPMPVRNRAPPEASGSGLGPSI